VMAGAIHTMPVEVTNSGTTPKTYFIVAEDPRWRGGQFELTISIE
jgi:hypothetical protein